MTSVVSRLVDSLFLSIQEQPPWLSFLAQLEREMDCLIALVLRNPRKHDPGVILVARSSQDIAQNVKAYQEQYFDQSFFPDAPCDKVFALNELFSSEDLEQQPYFRAYLRDRHTRDLIYLNLRDPDSGATLRLRGARMTGQPQFGAHERKLLQQMLPRIKTAFAIYSRLERLQFELGIYDENISNKLAVGSIMLGEYGEIVMMNGAAAQLLKDNDGFFVQSGVLRCSNEASDKALKEAVTQIIQALRNGLAPQETTVRIKCAGGDRHWNVLCRPVLGKMALDGVST